MTEEERRRFIDGVFAEHENFGFSEAELLGAKARAAEAAQEEEDRRDRVDAADLRRERELRQQAIDEQNRQVRAAQERARMDRERQATLQAERERLEDRQRSAAQQRREERNRDNFFDEFIRSPDGNFNMSDYVRMRNEFVNGRPSPFTGQYSNRRPNGNWYDIVAEEGRQQRQQQQQDAERRAREAARAAQEVQIQKVDLVPCERNNKPALAVSVEGSPTLYIDDDSVDFLVMQLMHWKEHRKMRVQKQA